MVCSRTGLYIHINTSISKTAIRCVRIQGSIQKRCELEALEKARSIVDFLEDKKAEKIVLLDIHEISTFTSYFIICNGTSDRMLEALASAIREFAKKDFSQPIRIEGDPRTGWMIADLMDVVVHIFSPNQRDFYRLEQLWEKGKTLVSLQ
ncbi:MAG: ribosome silencing factor [Chloroflexi bacterium]|nr:ribosome silencing factor [Chloroflexota bacterium]